MRRKKKEKRILEPDLRYTSVAISKFINYVMKKGKKETARALVYRSLDALKKGKEDNPLDIFDLAIKNISPTVEVRSKRVGGANYQVPIEVRPERKFALAARWLLGAARSKKGKPMAVKLAEEILLASKNEGAAIKKKLDTYRMAEANKAFAHFSR